MAINRWDSPRPVPVGTILFKDIDNLATFDEKLGEIPDGAVYIKGNVIQWVGTTVDLPEELKSADQIFSLKDRVMIPGMVNTHHHMVQCITRCIAQDSYLFGWLETCYQAWEHLTGEDLYIASKVAMAELIMSGCTTSSDLHYIYPNDVMLDDSIHAAREIGIRFHPTRGAMSLGQSKGGLPPDCCCEEEDVALADMKRVIEQYHDNSKFSMLRVGLAPCSPFTVTNELMKAAAALARKYEGVRLHTHLAENQEDVDFSLAKYGVRPGEYIKQVDWDKDDVWFAHCCKLDGAEMQLFAANGIGIAHCPSSNCRLGSGILPVRKALDAGVNVGLGVDGSASADAGNMLAEARQAMFMQRSSGNIDALNCREALKLAVHGGAKNLGRDDIGKIAPGFAADMVAWKTDTLGFAGGRMDTVAGLVLMTPSIGFVDLSVINGEVIVKDGKLLTLHLQDLIAEHNRRSEALCKHLPPYWRTGNAAQ